MLIFFMLHLTEHENYLAHVKMPSILGILPFNTTPEILKARKFFNFQDFSFYGQLKFHVQLSQA